MNSDSKTRIAILLVISILLSGCSGGETEIAPQEIAGCTDEAAENLYATIDSCADIVARAIRKHKEKHSGKGARHASHGGAKEAIIGADDSDDGDDVPPAA